MTRYIQVSGLPLVEEGEATGELAELYDESKRVMGMPFVPNIAKGLSASPRMVEMTMDFFRSFYANIRLPQSLIAIISYCIPKAKNCNYCSANNELHCRTIGIDEETLYQMAHELGNVSPVRVRTIIEFALMCALEPQNLTEADYDRVRDQGVSDEEIVEIIAIAGFANYTDTLADALKIEVDELTAQRLGQL